MKKCKRKTGAIGIATKHYRHPWGFRTKIGETKGVEKMIKNVNVMKKCKEEGGGHRDSCVVCLALGQMFWREILFLQLLVLFLYVTPVEIVSKDLFRGAQLFSKVLTLLFRWLGDPPWSLVVS